MLHKSERCDAGRFPDVKSRERVRGQAAFKFTEERALSESAINAVTILPTTGSGNSPNRSSKVVETKG